MDDGEFGRIARLAPHLAGRSTRVPVGVGDDAAVVAVDGDVVLCVDVVVEGVHVSRDLSSPADVGWKALAVNLSDVAAVGGVPRAAVVGLVRPPDLAEADVDGMYAGMAELARAHGVAVVGGDTVTASPWSVSVTALGEMGGVTPVERGGARVGDVVLLAGRLGGAAAALHSVAAGEQPHEAHLAAHRRPVPLVATGRALALAGATAMIDVSDGLGADARHLCEASDVALRLDRAAVESAAADGVREVVGQEWLDLVVGGGEDFALLATVPEGRAGAAVEAVRAAGEVEAFVLGRVVEGGVVEGAVVEGAAVEGAAGADGPAVWLDGDDGPRRIDHLGYDHG